MDDNNYLLVIISTKCIFDDKMFSVWSKLIFFYRLIIIYKESKSLEKLKQNNYFMVGSIF